MKAPEHVVRVELGNSSAPAGLSSQARGPPMAPRSFGVDVVFHYTEGEARKLIIGITALSSFILGAFALGLGVAVWEGRLGEGWMVHASGVCWLILILGFGSVSAACCYATWRGPRQSARTQIRSGDLEHLAIFGTLPVFSLASSLGSIHADQTGQATSEWGLWVMLAFAVPVGLIGALGVGSLAWNLATRGHSHLRLASNPVTIGEPLRAVLEVPFSFQKVPAVDLRLELTRSELLDPDSAPTLTRVLSVSAHIESWEPTGARRCQAHLCLDLDLEPPGDLAACEGSYFWSVEVDPTTKVAWQARFDVPIELAKPSHEGV